MRFEIGKYYKHTTDHYLFIAGGVVTHMWGGTLVAEENKAGHTTQLMAVGSDESATQNYHEIAKQEYLDACYSK